MERARDAQTAEEALRLATAHIVGLFGRYACIDEVPRELAPGYCWASSAARARYRPRLDPRRGEDILSSYMASDVYLRLVHRLGWTAGDFQRWLEATLAWRLLGTG